MGILKLIIVNLKKEQFEKLNLTPKPMDFFFNILKTQIRLNFEFDFQLSKN